MLRHLAALLVVLSSVTARGATITLTAPTSPLTLPDGDDYATAALADPWDFDQRRDFLAEDRISPVSVANGIWTGTARAGAPLVYPVYHGFPGSLTVQHLDMHDFGTNRPVDADKYTELSYRLNLSQRDSFGIAWTKDRNHPYACGQYGAGCNPNAGSILDVDGYSLPGASVANSGWTIYDFDLKNRGQYLGAYGVDWSGQVTGLQLQPTNAGAGTTIDFDWMRLVDPTTSPTLTITWSTSGAPAGAQVNLYVDGSGSGTCAGEAIARRLSNSGTYTLKTAKLPPGQYRFRVDLVKLNVANTALDTLASSSCSASVTITQAPTLTFSAPSPTSGEEYAASEVGNAWDMSDQSDIANFDDDAQLRGWKDPSFTDGVFRATAIAPSGSSPWSDATIHLNGPDSFPVDTAKYRWATFRLWNDTSKFDDLIDYLVRGGGLRLLFWDAGLEVDGTDPQPVLLFEDWHTYAVDLWNMDADTSDPSVPSLGWRALPLVSTLKVDPTEVQIPSDFAFDNIELHAENCTAGPYTVSWNVAAPTSSTLSVDLFADTDTSGADGTHLQGPLATTVGSNSAVVDLSSLAPGRYYIYARLTDERHTRTYYSRVPVTFPCGDFSPPAFAPQTGTWNGAGNSYRATGPALGTFPTLTSGAARVSATIFPDPRRSKPVLIFGYRSPSDFSFVEIDTRRGRVVAFKQSGNRRRKLKLTRSPRALARKGATLAVVLRVNNGEVQVGATGEIVLKLANADTNGAIGLGILKPGAIELTSIRGAAL